MLDDYKESQPIVYKILMNAVLNNRFSHAYLFETNGYLEKEELALAFAKYIMCPDHHHNSVDAIKCRHCIKAGYQGFSEITIINPDGLWIKKDQLLELQKNFSKKAIESEQKIYIINNAECLNTSAANSILKFLEEPEENIIAILMTDNSYQLLETIRSRCQIIPFAKTSPNLNNAETVNKSQTLLNIAPLILGNNNQVNEYVDNLKNIETINKVIEFVNYYEKNKKGVLLHLPKMWNNYFFEKELLTLGLDIMILYYKDVLNIYLDKTPQIFADYEESINLIAKTNTIESICSKLNVILNSKEKIKTNANVNLLIDKLIIDFEGGITNV